VCKQQTPQQHGAADLSAWTAHHGKSAASEWTAAPRGGSAAVEGDACFGLSEILDHL